MVKDEPNTFFLEMNCLEHGVHLVCLSGLQLMDKLLKAHERTHMEILQFTFLSIVTQVLRSVSGKVYDSWTLPPC